MTDPLVVDYCTDQAARYATTNWHYSGSMPSGKRIRFGVWEAGQFTGCVIFSRGSTGNIGSPYGLEQHEVCELTRVALTEHNAPVSQVLAAAIRKLKATNTGLRLVVSYADPSHGHHGGIYQAGNWVYSGQTPPSVEYVDGAGRRYHERQVSPTGWKKQFGVYRAVPTPESLTRVRKPPKHRYLYPLDRQMRRKVEGLRVDAPGKLAAAGEARR